MTQASYEDYGDVMVTDDVDCSMDIQTAFQQNSLYRVDHQVMSDSEEEPETPLPTKPHDSFKAFIQTQLAFAESDLVKNHKRLMQLVSSRLEVYSRLEAENKALKTQLEDIKANDIQSVTSQDDEQCRGRRTPVSRRSSNASVEETLVESATTSRQATRGSQKNRKGRTAFGLAAVSEGRISSTDKQRKEPKGHGGALENKPRKPMIRGDGVPAPLAPAPSMESPDEYTGTDVLARVKSTGSMESTVASLDIERDQDTAVKRYMSEGGKSRLSCNDRFEVLPVWKKDHQPVAAKLARMYVKAARGPEDRNMSIIAGPVSSQMLTLKKFKIWIVHPNSFRRGFWDMLSLILVIYDMAVIPLQLFDPPSNHFFSAMTWVTRIFWTLDVPASFFTGYMNADGSIEARPRKIAKNYVMTWFTLDILIIAIDWMEMIWQYGSVMGYARMGKASRTIRIIRMVRLLRLIRMRQVFRMLAERIQSERLIIVADIVKIMLVIVGLGHIIACLWYGIGASEEEEFTWVDVHGYGLAPLGYRYSTSLHWSLLLFSGGTDEIVPQNTGERVYAIFVYLVAFVMAAVFVSSLTSSMTQLHLLASQQQQKLSVLRRYLHQNGVSNGLALRVIRSAQHAVWEQKRLMPESQVELLLVVSEPLRVELHFELFSPVLSVHPFFAHYMEECPQVMRKVCHCCVGLLLISRGDIIFNAGEIPTHPKMYIICSGKMVYREISGGERQLGTGEWISEACLWCPWMHRGLFMGATECRLCLLDARKFQDIVGEFDHTDFDFDPKKYASDFVASLNYSKSDVSDMPLSPDSQIMLDMQESRQQATEKRAKSPPTHVGGQTAEPARRQSVLMPVRRFSDAESKLETIHAQQDTVAQIVASTKRDIEPGETSNGGPSPQRSLVRKPSLLFTTPVPGAVNNNDD